MRTLVILRAGNQSLHRNWALAHRTWQLAISSFSSSDPKDFPEADYFHFYKGGKWDGIHAFVQAYPEVLDRFDAFWLPDDDIDAKPQTVEDMFAQFELFRLELAQPSLSRDSFYHFPITLTCRFSRLRYTNFVEIMVPILGRDLFGVMLPLFATSKSGFGFDLFWARLTSDPANKCAIIDGVTVRHTRPVGSVLANELSKAGNPGLLEMAKLYSALGGSVEPATPLTLSLILRDGGRLAGSRLCGLITFLAQAPWLAKDRHNQHSGARLFAQLLYRQMTDVPVVKRIDHQLVYRAAAELKCS